MGAFPPTFYAFVSGDAFLGSAFARHRLHYSPEFIQKIRQRLIASGGINSKPALRRWAADRYPAVKWLDSDLTRLWADYLEWADAQPRSTEDQTRKHKEGATL
jgi:hypothetical protein